MIDLALLDARAEMLARSDDGAAFRYLRQNGVAVSMLNANFGFYTVLDIIDAGSYRFDFANEGEGQPAFLLEAFDADGETVADLVAWPVNRPPLVLSMFGRLAFLGQSAALNPTSYFAGLPLDVHHSPLEWLRAGCRGVAVVTPDLAAPILLDAPAIAGRDEIHTRQLIDLARSAVPVFDPTKFFAASQPRKAA